MISHCSGKDSALEEQTRGTGRLCFFVWTLSKTESLIFFFLSETTSIRNIFIWVPHPRDIIRFVDVVFWWMIDVKELGCISPLWKGSSCLCFSSIICQISFHHWLLASLLWTRPATGASMCNYWKSFHASPSVWRRIRFTTSLYRCSSDCYHQM